MGLLCRYSNVRFKRTKERMEWLIDSFIHSFIHSVGVVPGSVHSMVDRLATADPAQSRSRLAGGQALVRVCTFYVGTHWSTTTTTTLVSFSSPFALRTCYYSAVEFLESSLGTFLVTNDNDNCFLHFHLWMDGWIH